MKIRTKLSVLFTIIVATILIFFSLSVYIFSSNFWADQFYTRLKEKAVTTAKLLIEVNEVDINLLRIIDKNTSVLPSEQILVFDEYDSLLYNSVNVIENKFDKEFFNKVRSEKVIRTTIAYREVLGMVFNDSDRQYVIIASAIDVYGNRKLSFIRVIIIVMFFVSVAITLLAGWFYSGQALSPISKVVAQVAKITATNLHLRVDEGNRKDELANLSITFNKMLSKLENAFELQKSFVSNASHELRTPLTAIKGQIDVTLLNKRTTEEYEQTLISISEDISSLSELTNGLLDLAHANQDAEVIIFNNIRIDELLWSIRNEIEKLNLGYKVIIEFDNFPSSEDTLIYYGNEQLLRMALKNIIDNACKYSFDSTSIIKVFFNADGVNLKFIDKGIGISPEDIKNVFEPFYRAANVKGRKGVGLGLSLAKKVIELHEGNIQIESEENKGTHVHIFIKNATSFSG
jgi:signal transduction histidine kinase